MIVNAEVLREADVPVGRAALTAHFGWKGVRPGVRVESRSGEAVRSPKNMSVHFETYVLTYNQLRFLKTMMKKSSVSRMQWFMYFRNSVLCLGKVNQNPTSNTVWEERLSWFKSSSQYRILDK